MEVLINIIGIVLGVSGVMYWINKSKKGATIDKYKEKYRMLNNSDILNLFNKRDRK